MHMEFDYESTGSNTPHLCSTPRNREQESQPSGESVMRKRVRTCSDSNAIAARLVTGSA